MDTIHFAENLMMLRKAKKITQEQVADFCGVTKASVSKWETRQTMPDVLLLPRLAAFFGVSIDELLGYRVYLTKEQIHKIYEELASDFATKDFDSVMLRCNNYVKRYYSCYEFLEKIVLLWIGHEMLAGDRRNELLVEAKSLCEHILANSRNISLCNDVVFLQAIVDLLLGKPMEVVEALEEMNNPCRLSVQGEEVLLSAYIELRHMQKGDEFAQVSMYLHILTLISSACKFLVIHKDNLKKCEETKQRIEEIIRLYNFEEINFYYVTLFAYQMAAIYCQHGEKEKALEQFERYVRTNMRYLQGEIDYLQSDKYLDKLDVWFRRSLLDGNFSREKGTVHNTLLMLFEKPEFELIKNEARFKVLYGEVLDWKKTEA